MGNGRLVGGGGDGRMTCTIGKEGGWRAQGRAPVIVAIRVMWLVVGGKVESVSGEGKSVQASL